MKHSCVALAVCRQLFEKLDTSLSLRCKELLDKGELSKYVELSVDASLYSDWNLFYRDYCAVSLLSKWQHFDLGVNRSDVALKKFLESERSCAETNKRVRLFDRGLSKDAPDAYWVLHLARRKIESVLGSFSWDDAHDYMGFGPGATFDLRRTHGHSSYKFGSKEPTVTRDSSVLAACLIRQVPSWSSTISTDTSVSGICERLKIVRGNAVTFVPKNAKTDRVIAKEPTMNMFIQRGIGGVIRRKLKRVQVNLDDQTRNQKLALLGSVDGSLATIDLSAASDSLALMLVEWLLPEDWVRAIKMARSPAGLLPDGSWISYQKVSSMGNGYTFELESLIFWALMHAVMERRGVGHAPYAVYGDDLICPVDCVEEVISVLELCGFKTNKDKSFWTGPFRESCGKHYFKGRDVTPIYVKERVSSQERKFWLANCVSLLAYRVRGLDWSRDSSFREVHSYILETLPDGLRAPTVPYSMMDSGIAGDFDEVCPRYDKHSRTFIVKHRARVFITRDPNSIGDLSHSMWRISVRKHDNPHSREARWHLKCGVAYFPPECGLMPVPLPGKYRWRTVRTPTQRWEGLGPWL